MTKEDRQLLLKDLSARLPYNVKIEITWWVMGEGMCDDTTLESDHIEQLVNDEYGYIEIKPYLRSISSMTEEEKIEYERACELDTEILSNHPMDGTTPFPILYNSQDYLNSIHVDYRGLIPMKLAIEVTKENNPYKLSIKTD